MEHSPANSHVDKIFNDLNQEINNKFPLDYNTKLYKLFLASIEGSSFALAFPNFPSSRAVTFFHIVEKNYPKWEVETILRVLWYSYKCVHIYVLFNCLSQFYIFYIHVLYGFLFDRIICRLGFLQFFSHCSF